MTTAICVIDRHNPDKPIFQRKCLKNDKLIKTLQSFKGTKLIACEAAYGWFPLREALQPLKNITFVALDARKTSSWSAMTGIKTDKVDAQVICHVCLQGGIPRLVVHQPTREAKECFKLALFRDQLVQKQTKLKNQLKSIKREYSINQ